MPQQAEPDIIQLKLAQHIVAAELQSIMQLSNPCIELCSRQVCPAVAGLKHSFWAPRGYFYTKRFC